MKHSLKIFIILFSVFFIPGCGDKKAQIENPLPAGITYVTLVVTNNNTKDDLRFLANPASGPETIYEVKAGQTLTKKISARIGELFNFRVLTSAEHTRLKITDSNGDIITDRNIYLGFINGQPDLLAYVFLVFDPSDKIKNPVTYKKGHARDALDLNGKTFVIFKRYYADNNEDNLAASPACTLDDEFTLYIDNDPERFLSPEMAGGTMKIYQKENKCVPFWPDLVPEQNTPDWFVTNTSSIFNFPLYNATSSNPYGRVVSFALDSISKAQGTITFHAGGVDGYRKEVFIYKIKP